MISNKSYDSEENDLVLHWLKDIGKTQHPYKEPILDTATVKFFKQVCEALEQSTDVFILSIEVAEDYIGAKNAKKVKIADPLLAAVTITFMCHKFEGAPEGLKVKHVVDILFYFTQKLYDAALVTAMEGDIIVTLNGKLPITTTLDDLDVVLEKYVGESRLRADVRPLCLKLLEFVYMERSKWFEDLKSIYNQNKDCMSVFQNLVSSKFYLPVSIFITALRLTHYRHILDIDTILGDVTKYARIHSDHLNILSEKIMEIIN